MASSSFSSVPFSTPSYTHDVFLSFRGEYTSFGFTGHLYRTLVKKGIKTFIDDGLPRREEISQSYLRAIEGSKLSLIVFSENYAASKWCLDELVHILECGRSKNQMVRPIFYKVDTLDVRYQRGTYHKALAEHEGRINKDRVLRWREALSEASKLPGWKFKSGYEFELIDKIIKEISPQVKEPPKLDLAEYPVGIDSRVQDMLKILDVGGSDVRMVGIWGIGGIGKTTIAKAVYNTIARQFECSCFLANVREESEQHGGLVKLQNALLSDIMKEKGLEIKNVHEGITLLRESLRHKKILLVLDDVDDLRQLEKLAGTTDWFGRGSRVIITTRDSHLLNAREVKTIYKVPELTYHEALELFCSNAFKGGKSLGDSEKLLVATIVKYAQGVPLALKVLGSHLCNAPIDEWQAMLDGFRIKPPKYIQEILKISYDGLEDTEQKVFLCIAWFFKGWKRNDVIQILEGKWINAKYSVKLLEEKALIYVRYDHICMHDLLEEMGKKNFQESKEPGERSILWLDVLTESTGTKSMECLTSLDLSGTAIKEFPSSIRYLRSLEELVLRECEKLTTLPSNIYELQHLWCLDLQNCSRFVAFPCWSSASLKLNSNVSHDLWYVNLRGCKRLEEIPELPPKVEWINVADCLQLTRFAKFSNILVHEDSEMIKCIRMFNCQRLCASLALEVAENGDTLLNDVCSLFLCCKQSEFDIVFPGTEVPKWFRHRKDLMKSTDKCEFSFPIPPNFSLWNKGFAICAAAAAVENNNAEEKEIMQQCSLTATIDISADKIVTRSFYFEGKDIEVAHVWLCYIPFVKFVSRQSPPFTCGVSLEYTSQGPVRGKSYGVHLVTPEYDEDEDEDEDEGEDD